MNHTRKSTIGISLAAIFPCIFAPEVNAQVKSDLVQTGKCFVVAASRPTLDEAEKFALGLDSKLDDIRIFKSENGWYAITVVAINLDKGRDEVRSLISSGLIPDDALCSTGKSYVEEIEWNDETISDSDVNFNSINKSPMDTDAISELAIKDVTLGDLDVPCVPDDVTYGNFLGEPVRKQLQCEFGPRNDSVKVVFSYEENEVIYVQRRQFLGIGSPSPRDILVEAIEFYGEPDYVNLDNWRAVYGNLFENFENIRYPDENPDGVGLHIKGKICADGTAGTARCGNLGRFVIEYTLVNRPALTQSHEDGEARLESEIMDSQEF